METPAHGVRREVLAAERQAAIELCDQEIINGEVHHRIERDLDLIWTWKNCAAGRRRKCQHGRALDSP